MKKLFFTAIALLAFSGASMASNIEIEKVNDLNKLEVAPTSACLDSYIRDRDALIYAGFGVNTAIAIATLDYNTCVAAATPVKVVKSIQ